jgi:hypothetical protein
MFFQIHFRTPLSRRQVVVTQGIIVSSYIYVDRWGRMGVLDECGGVVEEELNTSVER